MSGASLPAIGNEVRFGLAWSRPGAPDVPASGLVEYIPMLPVDGALTSEEQETAEVSPATFARQGTPGPKMGQFPLQLRFQAPWLLEFLEHLTGLVVKTSPAPGVFQYVFTPSRRSNPCTAAWAVVDKRVEAYLSQHIAFSSLGLTIGNNTEIPAQLQGVNAHGGYLGPAVPAAANAGSYLLGPWARGTLKDETAGGLWVYVEQTAPLRLKFLQAPAEPDGAAWAAAATSFEHPYRPDGEARWLAAIDSASGYHLGILGERVKDLVEVIFPGDAAAHQDLAAGDVFELPLTWSAPAMTAAPTGTRYASAHWLLEVRPLGGGPWQEVAVDEGNLELAWPVTPRGGNLSRYPHSLERLGNFSSRMSFTKGFVDTYFRDHADRHRRFQVRNSFEGRELAPGILETVRFDYPRCRVSEHERPASGPGRIDEAATLIPETDDGGAAPYAVTVLTDRDWTPTAA